MPSNDNREYRSFDLTPSQGQEYIVEGYASTFAPYVLWEEDGVQYMERIDPHAFDECDMSDVVYRVDHTGPVYARTSNGSLTTGPDNHGLAFRADLSRTASGRAHHEDVKAGLYPKASFCFTVREDSYDRETHTRTVKKIAKLYDVSPVSFPANPGTDVSARACLDGVIQAEKAERLEAERREAQRRALELRLRLL